MSENAYDYVIVGAGMAGDAAAKGIREVDADGTICLVGREPTPPVTRPALSKKLWTDPDFAFDDVWLGTEEQTGATLLLGESVVGLDPAGRTVTTDAGRTLTYGSLLVATSGTPGGPDVDDPAGTGLVVRFRTVDDYSFLRERTRDGGHAVVVGGSYIATELAAALVQNGVGTDLVHAEERLLGAVFPPVLVDRLESRFTQAGVRLVPGTTVEGGSVEGLDGPVRLELSGDRTHEADVVVAGFGITLETGFAADAGLETSEDGGVVVDERLRTSDPHVWAAGDVAQYPDQVLGRRRVEHVDHATESGRQAGRNMAGAGEPYTHTPYYYSVLFEDRYEAVGTLDASLETVEDWQGEDDPQDKGVVYYVERESDEAQDVQVRGVLLWNVDGARDAARHAIASGAVRADALPGRIG
ncbi:NAD(P)/FAD-dependent oxidoreductase [Cellulomonas sp. PhB143]|uniref:NAD(P)/FAD-dependent oxidoreductase n=1 Tax=Cellulomonas sp. PhB143 TaxID=2485186 RepID=UPI000F495954|nr:FAD-dependent oxidoreductase [Cellulomonas sp. PhB143]ROS73358.1 apoptosis-inducing factor-like protein [Cellulomonas sp. PhB143]